MGLLGFLRGSKDSAAAAEPFEPNLPADLLQQYRQMAPRERRRLAHEAEEDAKQSLSIDPTRDYVKERDASLHDELSGLNRRILEAAKAALATPSDWREHWQVVVGQDDPPDDLWGWMIIEADEWPPTTIYRVPGAFRTGPEARTAGEASAATLWHEVNRRLMGG